MCPYYLSLAPLIYSACLPLHIFFWSLHPIMSLTSSPSSLHIMCPYYLSLAPLIYSAMSITLHIRLISSSHDVADQLSFISSYYVSILSQPCSLHLLCNVYHSSRLHMFVWSLHPMTLLTSSPSSLHITRKDLELVSNASMMVHCMSLLTVNIKELWHLIYRRWGLCVKFSKVRLNIACSQYWMYVWTMESNDSDHWSLTTCMF
jgi:hypothetical protein